MATSLTQNFVQNVRFAKKVIAVKILQI